MSGSLQSHGLYRPPGSSVHGVLQERILEWLAILLQGIFLGIEPGTPALQPDSLPTEPPGKELAKKELDNEF